MSVTERKTGSGPKLPQSMQVTVGIHSDTGSERHDAGLTLIELAEMHEFGLGVPQRSFIRRWADENEAEAEAILARELPRLLTESAESVGARIALFFQTQAQKFIATGQVQPELAKETIRRKGSSVPLKDTGRLQAGILGRTEVIW